MIPTKINNTALRVRLRPPRNFNIALIASKKLRSIILQGENGDSEERGIVEDDIRCVKVDQAQSLISDK